MTPLRRADYLRALLVFLLAGAAYAPTLAFDFVNFDDDDYVVANDAVLNGFTSDSLMWAFANTGAANWHPLTWLSLQLDATLFGKNPAGYHLDNLLQNALAAAIFYLALRRLTGSTQRSLAAAALWSLHPLHAESVAWVTERKDTLCGLFFALTLLGYARYVDRPTRGRWLAVLLSLILGLMAKQMLVTTPCVLLLLDAWPLGRMRSGRDFWRLFREKDALWLACAVAAGLTAVVQGTSGTVRSVDAVPLTERLTTTALGYGAYLRETVWPVGLSCFNPLRKDAPAAAEVAAAAVALLALTAGALALRRRVPALLVGWLWFLGMLVPVIGVVQIGFARHADRYVYLPHMGLFLALVWGAAAAADRCRVPRAARAAVLLALLAALAVRQAEQTQTWRHSGSLWANALAADPNDAMAWHSLSGFYARARDYDAAIYCLERALALEPGWALTRVQLEFLQQRKAMPPRPPRRTTP